MSQVAKHIRVAQTQGVEAGLEAYMNAPSSQRHPNYKIISRKRTPETRLAAYCKLFADKLEAATPRLPEQQEEHDDAVQILAEQVAALTAKLQAQITGSDPVEDEPEEQPEAVVKFITAGEAWATLVELGDDPDFPAPQDMDAPARNGQLYRLNTVYGALNIA